MIFQEYFSIEDDTGTVRGCTYCTASHLGVGGGWGSCFRNMTTIESFFSGSNTKNRLSVSAKCLKAIFD